MDSTIFWMIYIALAFWAIYQKWDEKKKNYTSHPYLTFLYFIFGSFVMSILFLPVMPFFRFDLIGFFILSGVILFTYIIYWFLNKISNKKGEWIFFDYIETLDSRYILPKFAEIIFQQVFFVSIFILSLNTFGANLTLIFTTLAFVLAHLNLFLFRSAREAIFYMSFSLIGAPLFVLLLIATESLWYTVAVHMSFYTFLSVCAWLWGVFRDFSRKQE